MSIEISVSKEIKNKYNEIFHVNNGCNKIISAFLQNNLEAKFVPNISVFNNKIEEGCTLTISKNYNSKEKLREIWDIIKNSEKVNTYKCSYLKIDGEFQGCVYNYIGKDLCPHNNF